MKSGFSNGNMKFLVSLAIGAVGAACVVLLIFFEWPPYLVVGGYIIGLTLCGFAALAAKSTTLDLRAFTDDPLGWRKAKSSYLPPKSTQTHESGGDESTRE